jgi:hypothetical protein
MCFCVVHEKKYSQFEDINNLFSPCKTKFRYHNINIDGLMFAYLHMMRFFPSSNDLIYTGYANIWAYLTKFIQCSYSFRTWRLVDRGINSGQLSCASTTDDGLDADRGCTDLGFRFEPPAAWFWLVACNGSERNRPLETVHVVGLCIMVMNQ